MNTRTYPRTLNEAFPRTAEYACAVERPSDKEDRIVTRACLVAGLVLALLMFLEA